MPLEPGQEAAVKVLIAEAQGPIHARLNELRANQERMLAMLETQGVENQERREKDPDIVTKAYLEKSLAPFVTRSGMFAAIIATLAAAAAVAAAVFAAVGALT